MSLKLLEKIRRKHFVRKNAFYDEKFVSRNGMSLTKGLFWAT